MKPGSTTSPDACAAACLRETECSYSTWWGGQWNYCYLFARADCTNLVLPPANTYGGITHKKTGELSMVGYPDASKSAACNVYDNSGTASIASNAQLMKPGSTTSPDACAAACLRETECSYSTWWGGQWNYCYLFARADCTNLVLPPANTYGGITHKK